MNGIKPNLPKSPVDLLSSLNIVRQKIFGRVFKSTLSVNTENVILKVYGKIFPTSMAGNVTPDIFNQVIETITSIPIKDRVVVLGRSDDGIGDSGHDLSPIKSSVLELFIQTTLRGQIVYI